jgi:hypothetical protein
MHGEGADRVPPQSRVPGRLQVACSILVSVTEHTKRPPRGRRRRPGHHQGTDPGPHRRDGPPQRATLDDQSIHLLGDTHVGELGNQIGPPNDVGFENFDYPTVSAVREALETLGIGYGVETSQPGRFYDYPGDPIANGVGTPVNHTQPR